MTTKEMVGVECGLCHEEAFLLRERKAYVTLKCCPRCVRRLDADLQEKTDAEILNALDKVERKRVRKEMSHEWAHSWHGKHVIVIYNTGDGRGGVEKENCEIRGMAWYASKNEDVGYGRIKVVIDEAELHRITYEQGEVRYFGGEGATKYEIPLIDGYRWGMGLEIIMHGSRRILENPLAFYVTWGTRFEHVLEEVDAEADRLAAVREAQRLLDEQEKEIARHIGEGI